MGKIGSSVKSLLLAIFRKGIVAWLVLAISMPIALVVAFDSVMSATHLYAENFIIEPLLKGSFSSENFNATFCMAEIYSKVGKTEALVLLAGEASKPCIGQSASSFFGSNFNVSFGNENFTISHVCSEGAFSPYIVVPISYISNTSGLTSCRSFSASSSTPPAVSIERSFESDVWSALKKAEEAMILAYALVAFFTSYSISPKLEEEIKTLRISGISLGSITFSYSVSMLIASLFSLVFGISLGILAAHMSLALIGSVAISIPYRPVELQGSLEAFIAVEGALLLGVIAFFEKSGERL